MITPTIRGWRTEPQTALSMLQMPLFPSGYDKPHGVFYSWEGILSEVTCSFHVPHRLSYSTVTVTKERDRRVPEIKDTKHHQWGKLKHTKRKKQPFQCREDGLTFLTACHKTSSVAITKYQRPGNLYRIKGYFSLVSQEPEKEISGNLRVWYWCLVEWKSDSIRPAWNQECVCALFILVHELGVTPSNYSRVQASPISRGSFLMAIWSLKMDSRDYGCDPGDSVPTKPGFHSEYLHNQDLVTYLEFLHSGSGIRRIRSASAT